MRLFRLITLLVVWVGVSAAATDWTQWSGLTIIPRGAQGTLMGGSVNVVYTGDWVSDSQVPTGGAPINYFTNSAFTAYHGVTNAPGNNYLIALDGPTPVNEDYKVEFRNSLTNDLVSVNNPIMAFVSLGRGLGWDPAVHYAAYKFNQAFRIIDQGIGAWSYGCPPPTCGPGASGTPAPGRSDVSADNKTIYGWEWHGMIQFIGSYSSITFDVANGEHWHGFTIGTDSTQHAPVDPTGGIITPYVTPPSVPEPATFGLGGLALGAMALFRRRLAR